MQQLSPKFLVLSCVFTCLILSTNSFRSFRPLISPPSSTSSSISSSNPSQSSADLAVSPSYPIERLPLRIGHGFDIHRLAPLSKAGQPLVISGVTITHPPTQAYLDVDGEFGPPGEVFPCELGCVAHSDGDVVYHSVVDAIFGALTLPDIGQVRLYYFWTTPRSKSTFNRGNQSRFPHSRFSINIKININVAGVALQVFKDTDERWRGCDSSEFMVFAVKVMRERGYEVNNLDVTVILERPKIGPFNGAMKANLVRLLGSTEGRVNVKARTHERLDSVGEIRALSCHVVLTLGLIGN